MSVSIKEYDGGRSAEISSDPDFVYLEVSGRCMAFDRAMFLHGVKKALGIAFVIEEVVGETV